MAGTRTDAPPARMRLMGDSFAYSSPGLVSTACRHSVTMLFSVGEGPVRVQWGQDITQGAVLLVAPMVERTLAMADTPFALVDLEPYHAGFRSFALAYAGGVHVLTRGVDTLHHLAREFHAGRQGGREFDVRIRGAVTELAATGPEPAPLDLRVLWMMRAMNADPCITLERLARELGMSPTRASRLFSAQIGIPSRAYALAAKIRLASRYVGTGRSLTDVAQAAGFADSAHFAKVWLRCYGAPPSTYFPAWRTALDADGAPHRARWPPRFSHGQRPFA